MAMHRLCLGAAARVLAALALAMLGVEAKPSFAQASAPLLATPTATTLTFNGSSPVNTIAPEFTSFTIDKEFFPLQVVPSWVPEVHRMVPVNWSDPVLRAVLGKWMRGSYLLVEGTYTDYVIYDVPNQSPPPPACPHKGVNLTTAICPPNSWPCCLSMSMQRYAAFLGFAHDVGMRPLFNLNLLYGPRGLPPRYGAAHHYTVSEPWDPSNARALLEWTRDNVPRDHWPAGFGLGNELNDVVPAKVWAQDTATLVDIVQEVFGGNNTAAGVNVPFVFGPNVANNDEYCRWYLGNVSATSARNVRAYSHHWYSGGVPTSNFTHWASWLFDPASLDSVEAAITSSSAVRDRAMPRAESWFTEFGETYGMPRWPNGTLGGPGIPQRGGQVFFVAHFLGAAARSGVQVLFRETMAGDWLEALASYDRGDPEQPPYHPHPGFYALALFRRVMGLTVLDASAGAHAPATLRVYAHCSAGAPAWGAMEGDVRVSAQRQLGVMVVNLGVDGVDVSLAQATATSAYALTTPSVDATSARLNGRKLAVSVDGTLPNLQGKPLAPGTRTVHVEGRTVMFLQAQADEDVLACATGAVAEVAAAITTGGVDVGLGASESSAAGVPLAVPDSDCCWNPAHACPADNAWPDISTVPADLDKPAMAPAGTPPAAGVRVDQRLDSTLLPMSPASSYGTWPWDNPNSTVHHMLYLPTDWDPSRDKPFPILVDFAGNGPFNDSYGDVSNGTVEGESLGYGLSGGDGYIWVSAPYLAGNWSSNMRSWWGTPPTYDVNGTVAYVKALVPHIVRSYNGDAANVFAVGFSRGAIATSYVALHDDEVAALWRGFLAYGHYDGRPSDTHWPYPECDRAAALRRLARIGDRPSFVVEKECGANATRAYVAGSGVVTPAQLRQYWTFATTGYRNHNDRWTLRPSSARDAARAWLSTWTVSGARGDEHDRR